MPTASTDPTRLQAINILAKAGAQAKPKPKAKAKPAAKASPPKKGGKAKAPAKKTGRRPSGK